MTIQEAIANKNIKLIHNKNSFEGVNVELVRTADGSVLKFIHASPKGLPREETNNERSSLARNTSNDWVEVVEKKAVVEPKKEEIKQVVVTPLTPVVTKVPKVVNAPATTNTTSAPTVVPPTTTPAK